MSQHDFFIDNVTGAPFRIDINNALAALVSGSSGATEPTTTYAYQFWADTTTGILKIRNAANDGWVELFSLASGITAAARTVLDDATVSAMVDTLGGAAATGTGGLARATSPTLVTPALGTPASGDLRNCSMAVAPAIGGTTPSTGAFTTLSASGDISASNGNLSAATTGTDRAQISLVKTSGTPVTWGLHVAGSANGFGVADQSAYFINGSRAQVIWSIPSVPAPTMSVHYPVAVTGAISSTTTIKTGGYTVATLPAGTTGDRAYVTDATAPTYLSALTGGGAVVCPVFKNASAWVSA